MIASRPLSQINTEMAYMNDVVLQNHKDILTVTQGRICAVIKIGCCVYVPDNSDMTRHAKTNKYHELSFPKWSSRYVP